MNPNTFNLQNRGTIGKSVGKMRMNDTTSDFIVCQTHDHVLYFRYVNQETFLDEYIFWRLRNLFAINDSMLKINPFYISYINDSMMEINLFAINDSHEPSWCSLSVTRE